MNSLLTENELSFKKDVREFVNKELMPHVEEWERRKKYAKESVKKFADYGLFGILIPPASSALPPASSPMRYSSTAPRNRRSATFHRSSAAT
jgi:alkylation response protein AidB-like acyl-CoA dehydrogenase